MATTRSAKRKKPAPADVSLSTASLEQLLGYNLRRATLVVLAHFMERMAVYGLRPVEFSVLTLIHHNPGVTARQIGAALDIRPPNLVGLIASFEARKLIRREPHPSDGRAIGLHLSPAGRTLMLGAERTAAESEGESAALLTATELQTLMRLLRKLYGQPGTAQVWG